MLVTGTLKWNFQCPVVRELMLALGLVDVSKRTLLKVLYICIRCAFNMLSFKAFCGPVTRLSQRYILEPALGGMWDHDARVSACPLPPV